MVHFSDLAACRPTTACKVCAANAVLYGVADFNKSCDEAQGRYLPLAGVPVYYHRCESCGLVFTESMDHWDKGRFREHIYNDRYVEVDPDYPEIRPRDNARIVAEFLRQQPTKARHLDYGGGNGRLAALLRADGFDSSSWDPMDSAAAEPAGRYDVVTAFEVIEHTPAPRETLRQMVELCSEAAPLMLFSTYTIDRLPPRSMDFWYLAPRNGHITVHTESSLRALFDGVGLQLHHYGNGWHLAYRHPPSAFDRSLFERLNRRSIVRRVADKFGKWTRSTRH